MIFSQRSILADRLKRMILPQKRPILALRRGKINLPENAHPFSQSAILRAELKPPANRRLGDSNMSFKSSTSSSGKFHEAGPSLPRV
jgi:hypothetical protein